MSKLAIILCSVLFVSAANTSFWSPPLKVVQQRTQEVIDVAILKIELELGNINEKADAEFGRHFNVAIDFGRTVWEEITEVTQNATVEISKFSDKTTGVNISECIDFSDHIVYIAKAAVTKTSACIANELESGYRHVNNINKAAEEVFHKLKQISEEAKRCGDNVSSPKSAVAAINCAQVAAANATWISDKFRLELYVKITELNILLDALTPNVGQCTLRNGYVTVREKSATVVERTKGCMQRKIAEARNNA